MHLPRDVTAVAPPSGAPTSSPSDDGLFVSLLSLISSDGNFKTGDWSSLIGIITAICGNILISIALNTQRYAHIRLSKQYQAQQRLVRRAQKRARVTSQEVGRGSVDEGYGTAGEEPRRSLGYRDVPEEEDRPLLGESVHSEVTDAEDEEQGEAASKEGEEGAKSYLKSPYWWAGIILMTIGEAGNFLAYGFAPASIVSPLGVVALISNCVIAPFFLKERFRKRDLLGVVIAVGGAVTVVLSANDSNPKLGPKEIWRLISTWEFETYLGITIALIAGLMWASSRYGDRVIFIDLGLVGLFGEFSRCYGLFDLCILISNLGGYTALSTKGVASMLSYTLFKALTFPITYLLVAILVGTAIMQIKYVNRALRRFDATQVIPTQFVMFTLSVIIGSAVLYRDFEKESAANAGKFIGGCAMTFLGVYFITSARDKGEEEDEVLEEDEEAIRLASEGVYHDDPEEHVRPNARRSSTAPLGDTIPVNGHKTQSPPGSLIRTSLDEHLPHITRTSTSQSVSILDGEISEPASYVDSPIDENTNPWITPEEHSSAARQSIKKLLRPLDKVLPQSKHDRKMPSTLKATTSEPILPTEATLQPERPHTPPNASHDEIAIAPHTPDGAHLLARHSITDFIPGPFTSTLSSPLSAIVADSLRRGVDIKSLKPKRRKIPGVSLRRGSLQPQRNNSETDALHAQVGDVDENEGTVKRNRMRSFSNTLGDLFRSQKRVRRESEDEEAYPGEERRISRVDSSERDG
jgi:drug/metabolite transporter (DMT)-like permease